MPPTFSSFLVFSATFTALELSKLVIFVDEEEGKTDLTVRGSTVSCNLLLVDFTLVGNLISLDR